MSMLKAKNPNFGKSLTKQSFRQETDINRLLDRAQKAGTLSHLEKYQPMYGEMSDFNFFEAQVMLSKGREAFMELPSEIRKEFNQSPKEFFDFVNDPANKNNLAEKLPALAKPGRQIIDVSGKTPPVDPPAAPAASEPSASVPTPSEGAPETPSNT